MRKYVASLLLLLITVVFGIGSISTYEHIEGKPEMIKDHLVWSIEEDSLLLSMVFAKELDPNYEWLRFDESVPEALKEEVNQSLLSYLNSFQTLLDDENYQYLIQTKDGKQLKSDAFDVSNALVHGIYEFNEKGYVLSDGDFSGYQLTSNTHLLDELSFVQESDMISNIENLVTIQLPKNMTMEIVVPNQLIENGLWIDKTVNSFENYNFYSMWLLLAGAGIVCLFVILCPIRYLINSNPFRIVKSVCFEGLLLFYFIAIVCFSTGMLVLIGTSVNGEFVSLLQSLGMSNSECLVEGINLVAWVFYLFLCASACFSLKYIFCYGFLAYLKDHTLVSMMMKKGKAVTDQLLELDLHDHYHKKLFQLLCIHLVIICFIAIFSVFGWLLLLIYIIWLFYYLKNKLQHVQEEYDLVLSQMEKIAHSDFKEEISVSATYFQTLQMKLLQIQKGFAQAVKEETKASLMKTELISNVSHDLKTPLTGILNYVELLQQDTLSETDRTIYLKQLEQYSKRLATLIEDLFEVSKASSGNISLEKTRLDVCELISQVYADMSEQFETNALKWVAKMSNEPIYVELDAGKSVRIFENLFSNICKYAMPHTRVYLDVFTDEKQVHIILKNTSKEAMNFTSDEIMERFVRGDRSRHEKGSGLGLAIVKSFIQAQEGTFDIIIDGDLFKSEIIFDLCD